MVVGGGGAVTYSSRRDVLVRVESVSCRHGHGDCGIVGVWVAGGPFMRTLVSRYSTRVRANRYVPAGASPKSWYSTLSLVESTTV